MFDKCIEELKRLVDHQLMAPKQRTGSLDNMVSATTCVQAGSDNFRGSGCDWWRLSISVHHQQLERLLQAYESRCDRAGVSSYVNVHRLEWRADKFYLAICRSLKEQGGR